MSTRNASFGEDDKPMTAPNSEAKEEATTNYAHLRNMLASLLTSAAQDAETLKDKVPNKAIGKDGKLDWKHVDQSIAYAGKKITLPDDPARMPIHEAIKALERKEKDEETIVDVHEVIDAFPLDGAVAFVKALKQLYGWANSVPTPGFFGPRPPQFVTVDIGPEPDDKIQIPWGGFQLPGVDEPIHTSAAQGRNGLNFVIYGKVKKKAVWVLKEIADLTRKIVAEESIYRGKAIRLPTVNGSVLDVKNPPIFVATAHVNEDELVLPEDVADLVDINIWTPIQKTAEVLKRKIPLKRGVLLEGKYGCGKCLAKGTPILMFNGQVKAVQDVKEGDLLMGPDSQPRRVLSVTSGRDKMYRVTPRKGDPYVVNSAHILSLRITSEWCAGRYGKTGDLVNLNVEEFAALPPFVRQGLAGWRAGVEFPHQEVRLDPYFVGVWLGDGNANSVAVTTADPEIETYIREVAAQYGLLIREKPAGGISATYHITSGYNQVASKGPAGRNPILNELREYGLLEGKHIPHAYKINSREVRLRLLAGLADTDGYNHRNCLEIITKHDRLADDILFLSRSLSLAAYKKRKVVPINGKELPYWRIIISGDLSELPTKLARKQFKPSESNRDVLKTRLEVEPLPEDDYYGFAIDGDHLFLLGDFTVTHNTLVALVTAKKAIAHGWTYITIDRVQGLQTALEFAKRYEPAVIFAEDIDRAAEERNEPANDLLNILDGVLSKNAKIMVVLTTNHVEKVNQAMLRPGRLDAVISVKPPDAAGVEKLLRLYGRKLIDKAESLTAIGIDLAGQIPATIREVVERAKLAAIRNGNDSVTEKDLLLASAGMKSHLTLLNRSTARILSNEERVGAAIADLLQERLGRSLSNAVALLLATNGDADEDLTCVGEGRLRGLAEQVGERILDAPRVTEIAKADNKDGAH